jgi:ABC-type hemin transport system ATPase subunit
MGSPARDLTTTTLPANNTSRVNTAINVSILPQSCQQNFPYNKQEINIGAQNEAKEKS